MEVAPDKSDGYLALVCLLLYTYNNEGTAAYLMDGLCVRC